MKKSAMVWVGVAVVVVIILILMFSLGGDESGSSVTSEDAPSSGGVIEGGIVDLSSYSSFAQVAGLNTGIYCEGSQVKDGQTVQNKLWTESGNIRAESTANGATVVAIVNNDEVFVSIDEQTKQFLDTGDCEWFGLDLSEAESETTTITFDNPNERDVEGIECFYQNVANSKFEAEGKVCDFSDLFSGLLPS